MSTKWEIGVEKLFENEDYLIVNKPYDMYINSDDEKEKVRSDLVLFLCCFVFVLGYVSVLAAPLKSS